MSEFIIPYINAPHYERFHVEIDWNDKDYIKNNALKLLQFTCYSCNMRLFYYIMETEFMTSEQIYDIFKIAIGCGNIDIIRYLLDHFNVKDALEFALKHTISKPYSNSDDINLLKVLFEYGLNITDYDNFAIKYSSIKNKELLNFVINNGADIHVNDDFPLRMAVWYGNLVNTRILIDYGHKIDLSDIIYFPFRTCNSDRTCTNINMIKLLVEKGANINKCPNIKRIINDIKYNRSYLECILEIGLDIKLIEAKDLIDIIRNRDFQKVNLLKKYGVDFSKINDYFESHYCVGEEFYYFLLNEGISHENLIRIMFNNSIDF